MSEQIDSVQLPAITYYVCIESTIRFSALQGVAPMVERVPLEKVEEAVAKMMGNC